MQCPHCKKEVEPEKYDKPEYDAKYYHGSNIFVLRCSECHKEIYAE